MTIDIRVTKSAATLSCVHKGQMMTKKVQAMYLDSFEVAAVLQNLAKALAAVKTDVPVTVTLVGNDYVSNVVKGTTYLRQNYKSNFKKPNGSDAYLAEHWREVFKSARAGALLENNLLTFKHEYDNKKISNWTGD